MNASSLVPSRPVALLPLAAITAVHLGAQLTGSSSSADFTQIFLMPLLMLWVVFVTRPPRGRTIWLLLGALGLSWLGDTAPKLVPEGAKFLSMLGPFLIAQLVFCVAFLPHRDRSVLADRPKLAPILLGLGALLLIAGLFLLGPLAGAVVLYAASIIAMALLATAAGQVGVLGGLLFIFSDSLIALRTFAGLQLPAAGFLIMSTYVAAEVFLALALVQLAQGMPEGARAISGAGPLSGGPSAA